MSSKLLINEPPLQLLPSLAKLIGVNDAIYVQQLHYWLGMPHLGKEIDGVRWIRNSRKQWVNDNFPFWSESTISRIQQRLEGKGITPTRCDLNKHSYDRTTWTTIDYAVLSEIGGGGAERKGVVQCDTMEELTLHNALCQNGGTIPETTAKTTSKSRGDRPLEEPATKQAKPTPPKVPWQRRKSKKQQATAFASGKASAHGIEPREFRQLTDEVLGGMRLLELAALDDRTLEDAKDTTVKLIGLGYKSKADIQAIFEKWSELDFRGKRGDPPTHSQLLKFASQQQVSPIVAPAPVIQAEAPAVVFPFGD